MDSLRGTCWVCGLNAERTCPKCNLSHYCSLDCQKKDRVRHFEECIGGAKVPKLCSFCGKKSSLETFCWICCAVCYCSSSCQKSHELTHKELCENVKERILEIARVIQGWKRRGKNSPHYFGRLVHASDFLKWSDNEEVSKTVSPISPVSVLVLGADLKHLLLTLSRLPSNLNQELDFTLLDASPHLLSRNILLLYLLRKSLERKKDTKEWIKRVLFIYYSLRLDAGSFAFLCISLEGLQSMTFSRFMLETRNTIILSKDTFNTIRRIWCGWLEFSNDHEALNKLQSVRDCKISCVDVQQMMEKVRKLLPRGHQVGFLQWLNHGSFPVQESGGVYANVTLASFNPHVEDHSCIYPDIQLDVSIESRPIKSIIKNDLMIYSPYGTDMIFQDWDYQDVIHNTSLGEDERNLLDIYQSFIEKVLYITGKNLISKDIKIRFIMTELPDNNVETFLPAEISGSYDRICTGLYADIIGLPKLLTTLEPYLNKLNPSARLLTHHRLWSTFIEEKNVTVLKKEWIINNTLEKPINPLTLIGTKWAIFRQFLQAELFCYRNKIEDIQIAFDKIPNFNEIASYNGFEMVNFLAELNGVFPFRFRSDKRYVTMTDNKLYTLEWKKKQHRNLQSSKFWGRSITRGEISKQIPKLTEIQLLNLSKKDKKLSNTNEYVTKIPMKIELTSPPQEVSSVLKSSVKLSAESLLESDVSCRSLFWQKPCDKEEKQCPNPRARYFRREASFEYAELLSKRKKLESQDILNTEFRYSGRQKFKENRSFSRSVERCWNSNAYGDQCNELLFSVDDTNICGDRSNIISQTRQKGTVKDLISLFSKDKMSGTNLVAPLTRIEIEQGTKMVKESLINIPRERSVLRLSGDENSFLKKSTTEQNNIIQNQTTETFPFGRRISNDSRGKMQIKVHPSSSIKYQLNDNTSTKEIVSSSQEISEDIGEKTVRPINLLSTQDKTLRKHDQTQSLSSVKDIITVYESAAVDLDQERQKKPLEQEAHWKKSVEVSYENPTPSQFVREATLDNKNICFAENVKKTVNPVVTRKQKDNSVDNLNNGGQLLDHKAIDVPDMNSKIISPDKNKDKVIQYTKETGAVKVNEVKNSVILNIIKRGKVNLYGITHDPCKGQYRRKSVDENVLKDLENNPAMTKPQTLLQNESIEKSESESKKSRKNKIQEEVMDNYKKQGRSKSEGDLPMLNIFTDNQYKFDCKVHFKEPELSLQRNNQNIIFSQFPSFVRKKFQRGGKNTNKSTCKKNIVADTSKSRFSPDSDTPLVENASNKTDECTIKSNQPGVPKSKIISQSEEKIKLLELKVREDMTKYKNHHTQADQKNSESTIALLSNHPKDDVKNSSTEHKLIRLNKIEEREKSNEKKYSIYTMSIKTPGVDHRCIVNKKVSHDSKSMNSSPDIKTVVKQHAMLKNTKENVKPSLTNKGLNSSTSTKIYPNYKMYLTPANVKQNSVTKTSCSDSTSENPNCFVSKITWNPRSTEKEAQDIGDDIIVSKKKLSFKHLLLDPHRDIYCSDNGIYVESPPYAMSGIKMFSSSKEEIIKRKRLTHVFEDEKDYSLKGKKAVDESFVYDTENESGMDELEEAIDAVSLIGFGTSVKFQRLDPKKSEKEADIKPNNEKNYFLIGEDGKRDYRALGSDNPCKNVLLKDEFKGEDKYQDENKNGTNSSYLKSIFGAKSLLSSIINKTENNPDNYLMKEIKLNLIPPFPNVDQQRSSVQNTRSQINSSASLPSSYQIEEDRGKIHKTIPPYNECSSPTMTIQSVLKREGNCSPSKRRLRVSWGDLPQEGVYCLSEEEENDIDKKRSKDF